MNRPAGNGNKLLIAETDILKLKTAPLRLDCIVILLVTLYGKEFQLVVETKLKLNIFLYRMSEKCCPI